MLTLNNKSDYGLVMINFLSENDSFMPLSDLTKKTHLPRPFLARIASELVSAGILKSREGKEGGYSLAKPLHRINFLDYLLVFNKKPVLAKCLDADYTCKFRASCRHKAFLGEFMEDLLFRQFRSMTLKDVFENKK